MYFPLPANDEQRRIIQHLRAQTGVLVQGPPGTGKSHTIVNLVSHLLATNQRVLVTSHTARALTVLREKFPEDLRALCVTHLRGEEGARATLERSVQELLHRSAYRDQDVERRQLNEHRSALERDRQQEDRLLDTLRDIRRVETEDQLDFHGYQGRPQGIAAQLRAEEDALGWLEGLADPDHAAPLSDEDAVRLLAVLRRFGDDEAADLSRTLPDLASLTAPDAFRRFVEAERLASAQSDSDASARQHPQYAHLTGATPDARAGLSGALQRLIGLTATERQRPTSWAPQVVEAVLKGQAGVWEARLARGVQQLPLLQERAEWLAATGLSGTEGRDRATLRADAEAVLAHLKTGGGWGWGFMRPTPVRQRLYLKDQGASRAAQRRRPTSCRTCWTTLG